MKSKASEGLFRHSALLFGATMIGSACNMLFHVVMGHAMKNNVAEYGILVSMLGIILIVVTPMDAVRTAMAHFASRLDQEGRRSAVRGLVWRWCRNIAIPAVALTALGIIFSGPIAEFFKVPSRLPVILTSLVLGGTLFMPIFVGALLGLQSFIWMSVAQHSWGVLRLIAGYLLVVFVGATAISGILGQAIGTFASVVLGIIGVWIVVPRAKDSGALVTGVEKYFVQSLIVLMGYATLMNADILLVKHYFSPDKAGLFAQASTIGRSIIFLPMPVAWAMFPKVTSTGEMDEHTWKTLRHALLYSAVLILAAAIGCTLLPWLPLWILYGNRNPNAETIALVRAVLWAMTPLGFCYLLMNFELAQHRFRAAYSVVVCAIGYIVGVTMFHDTIWKIPIVLAFASVLSVVFLLLGLPRRGGAVSG